MFFISLCSTLSFLDDSYVQKHFSLLCEKFMTNNMKSKQPNSLQQGNNLSKLWHIDTLYFQTQKCKKESMTMHHHKTKCKGKNTSSRTINIVSYSSGTVHISTHNSGYFWWGWRVLGFGDLVKRDFSFIYNILIF